MEKKATAFSCAPLRHCTFLLFSPFPISIISTTSISQIFDFFQISLHCFNTNSCGRCNLLSCNFIVLSHFLFDEFYKLLLVVRGIVRDVFPANLPSCNSLKRYYCSKIFPSSNMGLCPEYSCTIFSLIRLTAATNSLGVI